MKWKLEIERVSNGYTLKGRFGDAVIDQILVVQEQDGDEHETSLKAMLEVLYEVTNYFGVYYSDKNKKNLAMEIVDNPEPDGYADAEENE